MITSASSHRIPDTTIARYPNATQPPAPHTRTELRRVLELLHAANADMITNGHGRHPASIAAAAIGFASLAHPDLIALTDTDLIGMTGATTTGKTWRVGGRLLILENPPHNLANTIRRMPSR